MKLFLRRTLLLLGVLLIFSIIQIFTRYERPWADRARVIGAKAQIRSFMMTLEDYRADTGDYPPEQTGLAPLAPRYLRTIPVDSWHNPYLYRRLPSGKPEVISFGADGQSGGAGLAADIPSLTLTQGRAALY